MRGARREALLRALGEYRLEAPRDEEAIRRFFSFLDRADPFHRADPEGHVTDVDVHAIPAFGDEPAHLHYDVRYLLIAGEETPPAPGAAWFARAAVAPSDTDGSLVRAVGKAALRLSRR